MTPTSLLSLLRVLLLVDASSAVYTNGWAVQIKGGDRVAERVARQLNCNSEGEERERSGR